MRVAQVTSYFEPHLGGVETHVRELSRELVRRGHEVTVITADTEGAGPAGKVAGFDIVRVPPRSSWFLTPWMPAVDEAIASGAFDVVHSHTPPPVGAWRAARACRRAHIPHVLTFHCDPEIPHPLGGLVVAAYRLTFGRGTLRRTDELITTTASYASTSREIWNYSPTVIPNAVDASFFTPGDPSPRVLESLKGTPGFRVLFVGRLVQHKGIEQLIDAMAYLRPPAELTVVGQGPLRGALEARARASPSASRIHFAGRVPLEDLPHFYRACDVFALPSVSRLEAFGIVALEAMASGLPVVASDIPGVREVVTHGQEGYLADPLDPKGFAARIDDLLAQPLTRARFGRNGRSRVLREYTWPQVAERVERLYERVAGAKRPPAAAPAQPVSA